MHDGHDDKAEDTKEGRRMLARMSPSLSQTHVVQSATAVHPSQNDASEIAPLTSSVTGESSPRNDDSRDYVPTSPDDFSAPDTPFCANERPMIEKDHQDARVTVGLSSPLIDPNVQVARLHLKRKGDHAESQDSSHDVPDFDPGDDDGNDNNPVNVLLQAPLQLEYADRVQQSTPPSQQPPTKQNEIAAHGKEKKGKERKEPSPDIIFLESTPASSSAPLTPSQHAAMYRQRMARKLEAEKRRLAVINSASQRNSDSAQPGSLVDAEKCDLIATSSNAGEAHGPSKSAGAYGSSLLDKQSAPGTWLSVPNEDEEPALGPMLMFSYLKSYNGTEKSQSQRGAAHSTVKAKRKPVGRQVGAKTNVVHSPVKNKRKCVDSPGSTSVSKSKSKSSSLLAANTARGTDPVGVLPHASLRLERAHRDQNESMAGDQQEPSTSSLKRPRRACN
ncbi:hypothetical protein PENTCL1PPCAC_20690 [Pristionchus entomophagus]|uniref:Uncharacterized protein n=1 Tax=Pristionchus entomophagus TaxID=358040 RepID=A0AAV5TVF4_9BILA|nr:hypothetical protein PENTCL1PPCAC_20690 [Pristionchus entomophagus]